MFRRDILILEALGLAESLIEHLIQIGAGPGLRRRARDTRQFFLDLVQVVFEALGGYTDLFKHSGDDPLAVLDQRQQQVNGLHFGVAESGGPSLRLLYGLLRLQSEFVPIDGHENSSCQRSVVGDQKNRKAGETEKQKSRETEISGAGKTFADSLFLCFAEKASAGLVNSLPAHFECATAGLSPDKPAVFYRQTSCRLTLQRAACRPR